MVVGQVELLNKQSYFFFQWLFKGSLDNSGFIASKKGFIVLVGTQIGTFLLAGSI